MSVFLPSFSEARTFSKLKISHHVSFLVSSTIVTESFTNKWFGCSNHYFKYFSTENVMHLNTEINGTNRTKSFRIYFLQSFKDDQSQKISPWHDISYKNNDGFYNMIVEIPKMTKAKMQINKNEEYNPISQYVKQGKLLDLHGPIYWNYGCIPQTWEDSHTFHPELNAFGDNEPMDVVEIGSQSLTTGSIKQIKPLGILALINKEELDWKVLAISTKDPMSMVYNDINDVPGFIKSGIREWFRWYKTPDGEPMNRYGYGEKYLNKEKTEKVIEEAHKSWKKLVSGEINVENFLCNKM